jgi:hypothetical protein
MSFRAKQSTTLSGPGAMRHTPGNLIAPGEDPLDE